MPVDVGPPSLTSPIRPPALRPTPPVDRIEQGVLRFDAVVPAGGLPVFVGRGRDLDPAGHGLPGPDRSHPKLGPAGRCRDRRPARVVHVDLRFRPGGVRGHPPADLDGRRPDLDGAGADRHDRPGRSSGDAAGRASRPAVGRPLRDVLGAGQTRRRQSMGNSIRRARSSSSRRLPPSPAKAPMAARHCWRCRRGPSARRTPCALNDGTVLVCAYAGEHEGALGVNWYLLDPDA